MIGELSRKVITTFFRRMVVVTKNVDPGVKRLRLGIDAELRVLERADIPLYVAFKPFQAQAEIEQRLSRGHLCFAAFYQGRIVHAGWCATRRVHVPYIHSDIVLGPKDFYIYDSYTDPEFRRTGLVMARSSAMHVHFAERGFEKSYGVVALMNRTGLAIVEPAGYRSIGMYGCVRIGSLHRTWAYAGALEPLPGLDSHAGE